jgi:hypothetical protein
MEASIVASIVLEFHGRSQPPRMGATSDSISGLGMSPIALSMVLSWSLGV